MQPILKQHLPELREICRRFHVRRLDLFGSAARTDFDPQRSDIDVLVEFETGTPLKALDAYFGLKETLEELLRRPVDVVMAGAVTNPYLRAAIERTREPLYAA